MSQNKWITLETTNKPYQIEIIKGKLSEHEIHSVIVNKIDSSYLNFGEAELKVMDTDFEKALEIIKDVEK